MYIYIYTHIHIYTYTDIRYCIWIPEQCRWNRVYWNIMVCKTRHIVFVKFPLQGWRPLQSIENWMGVSIACWKCQWVPGNGKTGLAKVTNRVVVSMMYSKVWKHVPSCPYCRLRRPLSVRPSRSRSSFSVRPMSVRPVIRLIITCMTSLSIRRTGRHLIFSIWRMLREVI